MTSQKPYPSSRPPRWCPAFAFPERPYLPGRGPHPSRVPTFTAPDATALPPDRWREDDLWLFGVDLFNHGYWWEAHEVWETRWRASADAPTRPFLAALIQIAAALIQRHVGREGAMRRLADRAASNLESVVATGAHRFMGLDVADTLAEIRATFEARAEADLVPALHLEIDEGPNP